ASRAARPMPRNLPAPLPSATLPSSEPMSSPWLCARLRMLADVAEFLVADGDALLHALGSRRRAVGPQGLPVRNGEHVVLEGGLRGAPVALDVHGLVHRRLGEPQRVGILQGDALSQLQRRLRQLRAGNDTIDEAQLPRGRRVDVVAREEILLRLPRAEIPRHGEVLYVR